MVSYEFFYLNGRKLNFVTNSVISPLRIIEALHMHFILIKNHHQHKSILAQLGHKSS